MSWGSSLTLAGRLFSFLGAAVQLTRTLRPSRWPKHPGVTIEQCYICVKVSTQQPLLCRFRLFLVLQDIKDGLIEDSQKQALRCLRVELFRLTYHVVRSLSV